MELGTATKVKAGMRTLSPGSTPDASRDNSNPEEALLTPRAYLNPNLSQKAYSSFATGMFSAFGS